MSKISATHSPLKFYDKLGLDFIKQNKKKKLKIITKQLKQELQLKFHLNNMPLETMRNDNNNS